MKDYEMMYEVDGEYRLVKESDAIKILSPEEKKLLKSGCRVGRNDIDAWHVYRSMNEKIHNAVKAGRLQSRLNPGTSYDSSAYVIKDDLGMKGIQSMVTGKHHDSKAAYRKELKAHGMVEMGNDAPKEGRKELRGDFDCRPALAQAIEQTGLMDRLKKGERLFND